MWDSHEILNRWKKDKVLEILIINAESFELYLSNMKSYMTRQIRSAYMTIFRSCDGRKISWQGLEEVLEQSIHKLTLY